MTCIKYTLRISDYHLRRESKSEKLVYLQLCAHTYILHIPKCTFNSYRFRCEWRITTHRYLNFRFDSSCLCARNSGSCSASSGPSFSPSPRRGWSWRLVAADPSPSSCPAVGCRCRTGCGSAALSGSHPVVGCRDCRCVICPACHVTGYASGPCGRGCATCRAGARPDFGHDRATCGPCFGLVFALGNRARRGTDRPGRRGTDRPGRCGSDHDLHRAWQRSRGPDCAFPPAPSPFGY